MATPASQQDPVSDLGRRVYHAHCYFCHGYYGDANTVAARYLSPPPRDFTEIDPKVLDRTRMVEAVRLGRPGTAMAAFAKVLSAAEIDAVVDFVVENFVADSTAVREAYHTPENGWPEHERYRAAFPYATGTLAVDTPDDTLDEVQRAGLRLFMSACITCHEPVRIRELPLRLEPRAVSFPRGAYAQSDPQVDAQSAATPYAQHDVAPRVEDPSPQVRAGERLFQANCAYCHAADGTGRHWIGQFLLPHPRDLTRDENMADMTRDRLKKVIREGIAGTTMPAWGSVLTEAEIEAIVHYIDRAMHPLAD